MNTVMCSGVSAPGLRDVVGVVEADGEERARLDRRRQTDAGERQPVRAGVRDLAHPLQGGRAASEQLGERGVQRRVGGREVDDLVAGGDRRTDAGGGVEGGELHGNDRTVAPGRAPGSSRQSAAGALGTRHKAGRRGRQRCASTAGPSVSASASAQMSSTGSSVTRRPSSSSARLIR